MASKEENNQIPPVTGSPNDPLLGWPTKKDEEDNKTGPVDPQHPDIDVHQIPDPDAPANPDDPLLPDGHPDTYPVPPVGSTPDPKIPGSPGIDDPDRPPLLDAPDTSPIGEAPQREVQKEELASHQMTELMKQDSAYMRQARQEGLELGGGLGGTQGMRNAMGEAMRRGLPIALADAQAYMDAAAQNMDALTQFGLANIQRATQLELGVMDANTRIQTTYMNNTTMTAIARMEDIRARDISAADNATKLRITELNGKIQESLAHTQFMYNQVLNDQLHANNMEDIALQGEYNLETEAARLAAADQMNYTNMYIGMYEGALDRLSALNGLDIDDAAIQRSTDAIWEGFYASAALLSALYPNSTPIEFEGQGG